MWASIGIFVTLIYTFMFPRGIHSNGESFSFYKFRGPVSGEVEEIVVSDARHLGEKTVDYVAKPDYSFHYGVQDPETGNSQGHKESRDGDTVTGEYRVLQDDGIVRIVRYTADPENGFQVHIEYARLNQQFGQQP